MALRCCPQDAAAAAAAGDDADEVSMTVEQKLLADAQRLAASIQVGVQHGRGRRLGYWRF